MRDLAREAIEFVEGRRLLTIPPLAREVWRMEMLSPERQKESPFFLGGETIQVAPPTDEMVHEEKPMSLRFATAPGGLLHAAVSCRDHHASQRPDSPPARDGFRSR